MLEQWQVDIVQKLCKLSKQANPANTEINIISLLLDELINTREELKGYEMAAEELKNQKLHLIGEVMKLSEWKQNSTDAINSIKIGEPFDILLSPTGIETKPSSNNDESYYDKSKDTNKTECVHYYWGMWGKHEQ